jgi:hypothetical protein
MSPFISINYMALAISELPIRTGGEDELLLVRADSLA